MVFVFNASSDSVRGNHGRVDMDLMSNVRTAHLLALLPYNSNEIFFHKTQMIVMYVVEKLQYTRSSSTQPNNAKMFFDV